MEPASSRELLTVVVPCLNEQDNIEDTIADILSQRDSLGMDLEILMVDDGSVDSTASIMERLCDEHDICSMLKNERNLGVGGSVLSAYEHIREGSWVTVIPGDNEFRFDSIHNFTRLRHDYDVILGYFQNPVIRPFSRRAGSNAFRLLANTLYGLSFRYLNGMKLYKLEVFQGIDVFSTGHAYNAELMAKAVLRKPSLRMGEAPFIARGRRGGFSNAFKPKAMGRAAFELYKGMKAVDAYRDEVIKS